MKYMIILLFILLLISIFLEGTVTSLPLVFLCLLCLTILLRDSWLFLVAFLAGIFLDTFALRPLGESSIFFLIVVFLILLYQRKYEINTYPFVLIASFVGSLIFLVIFAYNAAVILASVSAIIAILLFMLIRIVNSISHGRY